MQFMSRTMVEILSKSPSEPMAASDYLPDSIAGIFAKREVADPRIQALLRGLGEVDCRELADELREFAETIGAHGAEA